MLRTLRFYCLLAICAIIGVPYLKAQTTLSTTALPNDNGSGTVTFNLTNNNSSPIVITDIEGITGNSGTVACELWYNPTPVNGSPGNISGANGWTQVAAGAITGIANTTTSSTQVFFSGLTFVIPANTTYGIAVYADGQRYSGTTTSPLGATTISAGGVDYNTGPNIGYGGGTPPTAPSNSPRGWIGTMTFNIGGVPTCLSPTVPFADNVTATGADLNWTDNNGASLWEVEYGPAPLTPGTGTVDYTSNNPYSIPSGLTPSTNYQFRVKAICGSAPGDTSFAVTGSFTTPPGCGGNFYDSGGPTGAYSNSEDDTTTIYPVNPGDVVTVTFSSFYTENNWDYLYVYDGPDVTYPLIGTFTGGPYTTGSSNLPGPFTSSDPSGALTFRFHSDGSGTRDGWEAAVICAPPPTCLAATGLFAANVTATGADLNWTDNNGASLWEVEYGPAPLTPGTGTVDYTSNNPYNIASGLTSSTNYQFNVRAICSIGDTSAIASGSFKTPPGCGDNFYDSGGPTGTYSAGQDDTTAIYPANPGDLVTVTFSSFYTESCCDNLKVYDGPDATYPLLGTFAGGPWTTGNTNLPGPFTSSDPSGALTFVFHSDGSLQYDGWEATVTCAPPPTCFAATGLFAANVTATGADLNWTDNNGISLWEVEYGPAPLTPGTGTVDYTSNNPYNIASGLTPNTNYQFNIRAICNVGDTSAIASGLFKTPPGCGDNFYDSGGPTGAYSNNEDDTTTIYPVNPGDVVTVTFSSFYTENNWDYLYVYDGPDVTYPLIGTFTGGPYTTGSSNLPGPFTSSDPSGALTFRFHSDGSGTRDGWEAAVTCAPPPLCLAATGLFAANVTATGADLNWTDNNGTSLWEVEYGPAPLTPGTGTIDYTPGNPYSIASGLNSGTNYQFNIRAICNVGDTSAIASGSFKTPPGCGDNFYDSGGPTGVYSAYEDDTVTIYPNNPGDVVTVTFSSFYTESCCDNLKIYDGDDVTAPLLTTLAGNLNTNLPAPFISTHSTGALTFVFHSDVSLQYDGWEASVTCAPPPTCFVPSALGAANITTTAADLDWIENGSAIEWEIEYAQGNTFTIGSGTRETVNAKPYTLGTVTPLTPSTQYSYFVRSVCGANDTSAWSSRYTFNTALSNDLPDGAIPITLGAGCPSAIHTNAGGTFAAGEPAISCRGTNVNQGAQVWFSFVAPAHGFVRVSTDVSGAMDTKLGLFETSNPGDLTDLTSFSIIACDDDNGITVGTSSTLYASELTPGAVYYVAVNSWNGGSTGNFCVSVDSVTSAMIAPSGNCSASSETPFSNEDYTGWVTTVDGQGRLIANIRRTAPGAGTSAFSFVPSVTVNTGAVRDYNGQYYLDRNFAFTYGGSAAGMTFDLRLYFLNLELAALNAVDANAALASLNVTHETGACAPNFANAGTITALLQSGNGVTDSISWVNVNTPNFSNFYIMSGMDPLVIRLSDITATNVGASNRIEWNTLSEERSDKFELERSADGESFAKIYEKQANGEPSHYTYMDNNPVKGYNYYRLRMIEANGKAVYSEVVKAFVKAGSFEVDAYPNPVSHDLTVKVSGVQGSDATIQVTDVTGKVIKTIKMTSSVETINMSGLANGIYLIKYSDANHAQTIRVNKQ